MDQKKISLPIFLISLIFVALAAGGGMYWWQQRVGDERIESPAVIKDRPTVEDKTPQPQPTCPTLPIVTFKRAGLLTDTERKNLETKLINPYVDYAKPQGLVALLITVPERAGEAYEVDAIYKTSGIQGLLFGQRERTYGYWLPDCGPTGTCELTKEFIQKYPQIVTGLRQQGNTVVEAK